MNTNTHTRGDTKVPVKPQRVGRVYRSLALALLLFVAAAVSYGPAFAARARHTTGQAAAGPDYRAATFVAAGFGAAELRAAGPGAPSSHDGFDALGAPDSHGSDPVGDSIGRPTLHPDLYHRRSGKHAMVSCDVPLCSTMGKNILLAGGNAADAAVTVALCIGSVNLHSSGIGGGGFVVSSRDNDTISIDAREVAPARAHKNMYDGKPQLAQYGGLAIAVPGEVAGLYELYSRHGSGNLTWAELFAPVVQLNRQGWAAPEIWVRAARRLHLLVLSNAPSLARTWDFLYKPHSSDVVDVGDIITRPQYADTLELIARNGSAAVFYDPAGPIAPHLVRRAREAGGIVDTADFATYAAKVTPALRFLFPFNGSTYDLATTGGVSSGLALIAGLNLYTAMAENNSTASEETTALDPLLQLHRLVEAMKWVASARSHLGDVNLTYWEHMVARYSSSEWAQETISEKYSDNTTFPWLHYEPLYEMTDPKGTSHFSVVDDHGGAVSMTVTVNLLFGSLVYDAVTGVVLNDQMDDFSLPDTSNAFNLTPSVLNFIKPGNRPLSLTTPTIIRRDGELHLLVGAAGGSRIVTAVLQAIVRTLFHNLPLLETISYPRLHHQLVPEFVMVENITLFNEEFGAPVSELLSSKLNHTLKETGALTAMNAIKRTPLGGWEGVSDFWRKRGRADGY